MTAIAHRPNCQLDGPIKFANVVGMVQWSASQVSPPYQTGQAFVSQWLNVKGKAVDGDITRTLGATWQRVAIVQANGELIPKERSWLDYEEMADPSRGAGSHLSATPPQWMGGPQFPAMPDSVPTGSTILAAAPNSNYWDCDEPVCSPDLAPDPDQDQDPGLEPDPAAVPEPITIAGSAIALSMGGWMHRKRLKRAA